MLRTIVFPSKLSFLWNKQHCAIISLNVSSWPEHTVLILCITVSTFFLIFLFLVSGAKQELSISDTDDKEPSGDDEDDKGELKVDELLVLVGYEHFGGLSSAFGGLFGEGFERSAEEGLGFESAGARSSLA